MSLFIVIGARGWKHPEWEQSYYPEELPDDWQLSFYSHTFHAVLVPWQDWSKVDDVSGWLEDIDDEFRFFFELPADRLSEQERLGLFSEQLGQNWGGVVVVGHEAAGALPDNWHDALPAGIVEQDPDALDGSGREALSWRPGRDCKGAQTGFLGNDLATGDLRELKNRIMSFMTQANDDAILYLFVEGDAPAVKLMQDAITITEILGVA